MWFNILKNKLLTKPKTQLRIKDVKDIEDDEPCKKKLEEYNNYFIKQRDNHNIQNDTEITNIYNKHGLTNLEVTSFDDGLTIARHNNRFKGVTSLYYMTDNLDKDFLEIPEKVACRFLDLIESVAGRHSEEMDGYKMYLENMIGEREPLGDDVWIWEYHNFTAYIAKAGRYVYRIALSGTIMVEEIDVLLTNDREATNFYNDMSNIIMDKIDSKNWK
ncbi:MAG: hypothetical protein GOVbin140_95 [Prokaryotic dsDNA virus sp.]|nr:MAG: hypothetical protein GOVbin140_95 [Prokaryotic dsDNA virus sp.]|tara:strand:- start:51950 stop:52600 length:651 start_codon:yes stop_codon:yes gene_type:complete